MFIQVIEGTTNDPEMLRRRFEIWDRNVKPDAVGFLGSTGGCTDTGDFIVIARFENAEAAHRNSTRPEQAAWWAETERYCVGPVTFHNTEDVHVMEHGDLDDAHFVQVIEGHVTDRREAHALERDADPMLAELRPDLLGAVTAYFGDDGFAEIAYFTSEDDARRAERREMTGEAGELMAGWGRVMHVDRYLDLSSPWMASR